MYNYIIYSIDQLVCEYYNCTDEGDCVSGYEVCDENWTENPVFSDKITLVCLAVLHRNTSEQKVLYKACFVGKYGTCYDTCVMEEHPTDIYACCCNSSLCNNNGSLILPSNHTSSTGK